MGLDMYLEAGFPQLRPEREPDDLEWREVMYWRKANQIHGWIIRNVYDGQDDSGVWRPISRGQLEQLLVTCKKTLVLAAEKDWESCEVLLPPTPGFFFGSYAALTEQSDEDRDYYLQDVTETVAGLEKILRGAETDHFRYMGWW